MKILLTGGTGQIGWELQRTLTPLGTVMVPGRAEVDLTDADELRGAVRQVSPDIIVNAAAYTDVDRAESEPERAAAVNARAPGILARSAARVDAAMVHFSTDYVFDGEKNGPYTEEDEPNPINVYGETKWEGERAVREAGPNHLIIRTSWVYGLRRTNFLATMCRQFTDREIVQVVDDQTGSPTWCRLVAEATATILARWEAVSGLAGRKQESVTGDASVTDETQTGIRSERGTYHLAARGSATWHEFAVAIRDSLEGLSSEIGTASSSSHRSASATQDRGSILASGPKPLKVERIEPISSREFQASTSPVAARPQNSELSCESAQKVFDLSLPSWQHALALCLGSLRPS